MVFSSAIFLFVFFPAVFAVYHIVPGVRGKNLVLLLASLVFYSFGRLAYLPLLLASILVNWGAGRVLGTLEGNGKRRAVIVLLAVFDLGLLGAFKYLDFLVGNINGIFGTAIPLPGIPMPLGVSFFTFTALSYGVEVYRKPSNMAKSLLDTALYISLFPTILSGPIVSWKSAAPQLRERTCTAEKTARGIRRFIVGMAKKLLIADIVGQVVDGIYAGSVPDARLAWLGAVGYAVQIYFDFAGYSDMAIGIGQVFGFALPENFNRPYTALGLTDFWKRWHISLTTWFRNYVYMPLVMSGPLQKLYKKWARKYGRAKANRLSILIPMAVVWLLTGLWHGAAWSFVLWGLWHGLFCAMEGVGLIRTKKLEKSAWGRWVLRVYTWLVVLLGTVLFRSGSLAQAGRMFAAMFAGWRFAPEGTLLLQRVLNGQNIFCLVLGVLWGTVMLPKRLQAPEKPARWGEAASYVLCLGLLALCVMSMAQSGFVPFIYLQF